MNHFLQYSPTTQCSMKMPLALSPVACGFPSPADDFIDSELDLNEYVVRHPASTFYVRAKGKSMIDAGIHPDDILVVDKSLDPKSNSIVVACINGEFTVKRFVNINNEIYLMPCNSDFQPIKITKEMDFIVWGVVTYVLHKVN